MGMFFLLILRRGYLCHLLPCNSISWLSLFLSALWHESSRLIFDVTGSLMIFSISVDAPGVQVRVESNVARSTQGAHHRMVLVIIMVHTVAPDQLQIGSMRFEVIANRAYMQLILIIVDWISLWLAHDKPSENLFRLTHFELQQILATKLHEILVTRCPQAITLETKIFQSQAGFALVGHHVSAPVLQVLHPPAPNLGIMQIDPVIGEQLCPVDNQGDRQKITILQLISRLPNVSRERRITGLDQFAHGQRRNIVGSLFQLRVAIGITCDDARDLLAIMLDTHDLLAHHHWIAPLANDRRRPFPQFARTATRIAELIDQGFDHLPASFGFVGEQSVLDGGKKTQPFDALGGPVGG